MVPAPASLRRAPAPFGANALHDAPLPALVGVVMGVFVLGLAGLAALTAALVVALLLPVALVASLLLGASRPAPVRVGWQPPRRGT